MSPYTTPMAVRVSGRSACVEARSLPDRAGLRRPAGYVCQKGRFRESPAGLADGLGLGSVRRLLPLRPRRARTWFPRVSRVARNFGQRRNYAPGRGLSRVAVLTAVAAGRRRDEPRRALPGGSAPSSQWRQWVLSRPRGTTPLRRSSMRGRQRGGATPGHRRARPRCGRPTSGGRRVRGCGDRTVRGSVDRSTAAWRGGRRAAIAAVDPCARRRRRATEPRGQDTRSGRFVWTRHRVGASASISSRTRCRPLYSSSRRFVTRTSGGVTSRWDRAPSKSKHAVTCATSAQARWMVRRSLRPAPRRARAQRRDSPNGVTAACPRITISRLHHILCPVQRYERPRAVWDLQKVSACQARFPIRSHHGLARSLPRMNFS